MGLVHIHARHEPQSLCYLLAPGTVFLKVPMGDCEGGYLVSSTGVTITI